MQLTVEDCVGAAFDARCAELAAMASSFAPDLVIGVWSGGSAVAERVAAVLGVPAVTVVARRPTTDTKRAVRAHLLFRLAPRAVLDRLRVAEMRLLRRRLAGDAMPPIRHVHVPDDAVQRITAAGRILVVDDAVDSGATIAAVIDGVRSLGSDAAIRVGALTVTMPSPVVVPDFTTASGTLLRFAWSSDGRRARDTSRRG